MAPSGRSGVALGGPHPGPVAGRAHTPRRGVRRRAPARARVGPAGRHRRVARDRCVVREALRGLALLGRRCAGGMGRAALRGPALCARSRTPVRPDRRPRDRPLVWHRLADRPRARRVPRVEPPGRRRLLAQVAGRRGLGAMVPAPRRHPPVRQRPPPATAGGRAGAGAQRVVRSAQRRNRWSLARCSGARLGGRRRRGRSGASDLDGARRLASAAHLIRADPRRREAASLGGGEPGPAGRPRRLRRVQRGRGGGRGAGGGARQATQRRAARRRGCVRLVADTEPGHCLREPGAEAL